MDRQTFLAQLLNVKNVVQAAEGEDCIICKEPYSMLSSDTEIAEKQIRLPCDTKHTVGSNCIKTWLQEHNTCPFCRHELFPNPETGNNNEDEDEVEEEQDVGVGLPEMKYLCQMLCDNLGLQLPDPIRDLATQVAQRVWYTDIVPAEPSHEENFYLAAACVYMASHLIRRRVRTRDIVRVSPLSRYGILQAYGLLDQMLDEILDESLCRRIGTLDMEVVLRRLPKCSYERTAFRWDFL